VIRSSVRRRLATGLCCLAAACATGRASVTVSTLDPAYRDLEKLVAFGLVDSLSVGQRPYTRAQFARFARQARAAARAAPAAVEARLARLERRFGTERPVQRAVIEVTGARDSARPVPPRFFGDVDATVNPLLAYREGRHTDDGQTVALEAIREFRLAPAAVLLLHPRAQLTAAAGRTPHWELAVQEAYAAARLGNVSVQLGRAGMVWGQGRHAGLMISQHARGFDMVKLQNDRPLALPWLLGALGPTDATFFFATMAADRERHFPDSYLLGYKVSVHPRRWLEIGAGLILESGGTGAPPASLGERLLDHFFITTLVFQETGGNQFSNKLANIEARITLPGARGLQLYGEGASEDLTGSDLGKWLKQDSGWLIGASAPRLDAAGRFDASIEYHVSGIRLYRHHQFLTGLAADHRVLGAVLGPEGRGVYGELGWEATPAHRVLVQLAYEDRAYDDYVELPNDRRTKVLDRPHERRYRAATTWTWRPDTRPFALRGMVGYERVDGFAFDSAQSRDNFVVEARVEWRF
jgi:hypothetical protein